MTNIKATEKSFIFIL